MDKIEKIGKVEAISLLITIMANQIIFNIPSVIIVTSGSSGWLNAIYISILAVAFVHIISKLFKRFNNSDLIDVSSYLGGKTLKNLVGILYIILFSVFSISLLMYFANILKLIYFNDTPLIFLLLLFFIPIVVINMVGFKAITNVNFIFIFFTFISIIIFLFATLKNFSYERLFPIFGNGINETFFKNTNNLFAFTGISCLFFLNPFLKDVSELKNISITTIVISSFYLILSVTSLLMSFPYITFTDEVLSVYLLTRMLEFGTFIQRIDAIFLLIWILACLSSISLLLFYITYIFRKLTNISRAKPMTYCIAGLLFTACIPIKNIAIIKFIVRNIYTYYSVILIFVISLIILILANIKFKRRGNI